MSTRASVRKVALCGVLAAFAMVLGYLEHLLPLPIGIYGIKLGLSNLSTLILLYLLDARSAFAVHALRILATGLLFGNATSMIYSAAGGLLSFAVMLLLKKLTPLSTVGVSIAGGVCHNLAQLAAAIFLVEELRIALYLPVLLISGTLAGLFIGLCALPIIKSRGIRAYIQTDQEKKEDHP